MPGEHEFFLNILREIVSQPTAPYHEARVAGVVRGYLHAWDIPFHTDAGGNIIARYQRGAACRPLILMAHMDHPGFTVVSPAGPLGADWTAVLEGWVAAEYFQQPVRARLYPRSAGSPADGLPAHLVATDKTTGADARLSVKLDDPSAAGLLRPGDFGTWDLPDFVLTDGFIHARAIDDLVGCAAMLLTLWQARKGGWETDLYAVFTRAEEVGLVGAYVVLQSGVLPRDGYIVSLEASPALPGADQGAGPVIRVGDRVTTFSQDAELPLKAAAYRLGSSVWQPSGDAPAAARTRIQRQLMSKGSCEATAAVLLGYQATGLAMPLGNYHNMGEESRLVMENISADDYLTGVTLLGEAARLMPEVDRLRGEHATARSPRLDQVERLKETASR